MDYQVFTIDAAGSMSTLDDRVMLREGSICDKIYVSNQKASADSLALGKLPEIIFMCKNDAKRERYPIPGKYIFDAIFKTESKDCDPDPCTVE